MDEPNEREMVLASIEVVTVDEGQRKAFRYAGRELCRVTLEEATILYPALGFIIKEEDEAQHIGLDFEMPWEG